MPINSCGNGTWRIGDGPCKYTSRESVERAYVAYLADEDSNNDDDNHKNMIYGYKNLGIEIKDIDKKQGVVTGYFSAFDVKDSDGDIIRAGAFQKSINDWFPKGRIKHLLNHNPSQPLGILTTLKEDSYGLYYESKIGTHNLGQDFIKMVESDLVKEHSIGFSVIREQKADDANEMLDLKLYEGSSLTAWGANEFTPLTGLKSLVDVKDRIKSFEKFVRNTNASDEAIDMCLIEIKQLYQLIETTSSKKAAVDAPFQPKGNEELGDAIELLILKHF